MTAWTIIGPTAYSAETSATGVFAHVAVPLLRRVAQLADISEHQNGATGKAGEYINRRAHRGGVRVVSVIDHAHAVAGQLRDGPALDRLCTAPSPVAMPNSDTPKAWAAAAAAMALATLWVPSRFS